MTASRTPSDRTAAGPRALKAGGGGGTSYGIDGRVARLEAHIETLGSDVADLRAAVAALTEKVAILTERVAVMAERMAHLPSKGFVVTSDMTAIALFSGIMLFSEKLKALLGV